MKSLNPGDKIGASFGVTLNVGDHQFARIDCSVESTVREGENPKDAYQRVFKFCERQVKKEAHEYTS